MEETVKKEFQCVRGRFALIPYVPGSGEYNEDALIVIYKRLKEEGLWNIVMHENPEMSLLSFMNFFSSPSNLLQIFSLVDGDKFVDTVGVAWVSQLTRCQNILTRADASFLFFKEYQRPSFTDPFSKMILEYWFDCLGIDTIAGLTPSENRAAIAYIKRAGFKEVGRIPNFTTLNGEINAGVVTALTKDEYYSLVNDN